jgi:hypothetical protein
MPAIKKEKKKDTNYNYRQVKLDEHAYNLLMGFRDELCKERHASMGDAIRELFNRQKVI